MPATGWVNEPPQDEAPAMPLANMLMARRENQAGVVETSLARARAQEARELRAEAAEAADPDERAAGMIARGVLPGQVSQLSQRLGDTLAELQGEREKIEKGQRRAEQVRRAHERGQVTALDIARMDFDEGDEAKVARLERRAEHLQRQLAEASALVAPERQAPEDGVEAASRTAHEVFREITRQRMADAQAGRPAPRQRRPFVSAGGAAVRSEHCIYCTADGVDDETSYLLHSDPEYAVPVTSPDPGGLTDEDLAEYGRESGMPYRPAGW